EHEVDDAQYGIQSLRELRRLRHLVGDARFPDLRLRAHDALRERRGRNEERTRDLLGRETAHLAQRQCNLRVGWKDGVTAREDQTQAVVLDGVAFPLFRLFELARRDCAGFRQLVEACAAADSIDRLEATRRHEPRARIRRDSRARPLLQRGAERLVESLLRQVEVTEQTDERGEHAPGLGAIDRVDGVLDGACIRRRGVVLHQAGSLTRTLAGSPSRCSSRRSRLPAPAVTTPAAPTTTAMSMSRNDDTAA